MPSELLPVVVAGAALLAVIAYGVLAGADFGGGIWDLFAMGPRRHAQRAAIARAIAPVWEANHVWLIFVIVLLFAGFPRAFARLSVGLFTPLHWALVGITLRGAAFVFRAYGPDGAGSQRWGAVFGAASTATPVLLGMCLGATATRRLLWYAPHALSLGAFALALCAYVAAVFLTNETVDDRALCEDFRRRALAAGTVVVGLSLLAFPLLHAAAPFLLASLFAPRGIPVLIVGAAAALVSGGALATRRYRLARGATVVQVAFLLLGWGVAQFPYIVYPDQTVWNAAAATPTLRFLAISVPVGAALLVPALLLLFRVFKDSPIGPRSQRDARETRA
jgi:cytochrome d ubiquinol oxidase subunit II